MGEVGVASFNVEKRCRCRDIDACGHPWVMRAYTQRRVMLVLVAVAAFVALGGPLVIAKLLGW